MEASASDRLDCGSQPGPKGGLRETVTLRDFSVSRPFKAWPIGLKSGSCHHTLAPRVTRSSSSCSNVSTVASAAPVPAASRASFEG
jgi:hypothetical protein